MPSDTSRGFFLKSAANVFASLSQKYKNIWKNQYFWWHLIRQADFFGNFNFSKIALFGKNWRCHHIPTYSSKRYRFALKLSIWKTKTKKLPNWPSLSQTFFQCQNQIENTRWGIVKIFQPPRTFCRFNSILPQESLLRVRQCRLFITRLPKLNRTAFL